MLLLECAQLLLALFSSALYSPSARGTLGQHPYLDAAMAQRELANPGGRLLLWLKGAGSWQAAGVAPAAV
jgi:hypothetical protein